jgi:hypothetical protein
VIRALLRFIFGSPLRAAIICGALIAVGFGLVSYPDPELRWTVSDWRLEKAFVTGADEQRVLVALTAAQRGEGELERLSEAEFRALGLPYSIGFPAEEDSARRFLIRYAGMEDVDGGRVYMAERQVFAAPWWSPHRFIYKAAAAEVNAVGEVMELTFERDVTGLMGLFIFDGLVGAVYGFIIGLIVAVVRGAGLAQAPSRSLPAHAQSQPASRRRPA